MFKRIVAILCIWLVVFFNASVANAGGFLPILVSTSLAPCSSGNPCVQDFTTYTKVDASNKISSITSTTITSVSNWETRDVTAYVYKAMSGQPAAFTSNAITALGSFNYNGAQTSAEFFPLYFTDTLGDGDAAGNGVGIINLTGAGPVCYVAIGLQETGGGGTLGSDITITCGTTYYYTFKMVPSTGTYGTVYLSVYSDSGRTSQVGSTQTGTLASGYSITGATRSYIFGFAGVNTSNTSHQATTVPSNLSLYQ